MIIHDEATYRAHLIPYGNEVTLILDYKGLLELVRRSGDVVSIRSELVCENDDNTKTLATRILTLKWSYEDALTTPILKT